MTSPPARAGGPDSRTLIGLLLVAAVVIAFLPALFARSRRVQTMRLELTEVLQECRARYAAAGTAADTVAADAWQPVLHGMRRAGDPPCGSYRRRNMLKLESR